MSDQLRQGRETLIKPLIHMSFVNGLRLAMTLGVGVVMIRLVAGLGAGSLAIYLIILAWRWLALVPGNIAESMAVPLLIRGQHAEYLMIRRGLLAALLVGVLLSTFGAGALTASQDRHVLLWGMVSVGMSGLLHLLLARGMAGLLIARAHPTYTALMALRRFAELGCMATVLVLFSHAAPPVILANFFKLFSCTLAGLIAFGLLWPTTPPLREPAPKIGARPLLWQSVMAAASGQFILRLPVLVLGAVLDPSAFVPVALIFIVLGYLRQLATVLLVGLDGLSARLGRGQGRSLVVRASILQVLGVGTAALMIGLWLPQVLSLMAPGQPMVQGGQLVFARLMLAALVLRAVVECWIKIAAGQGRLQGISGPVVGVSIGFLVTVVVATLAVGTAIGPTIAALGLIVGQCYLLAVVLPARMGLSGRRTPPHGDADQHPFNKCVLRGTISRP